jgi:hypothetical protein
MRRHRVRLGDGVAGPVGQRGVDSLAAGLLDGGGGQDVEPAAGVLQHGQGQRGGAGVGDQQAAAGRHRAGGREMGGGGDRLGDQLRGGQPGPRGGLPEQVAAARPPTGRHGQHQLTDRLAGHAGGLRGDRGQHRRRRIDRIHGVAADGGRRLTEQVARVGQVAVRPVDRGRPSGAAGDQPPAARVDEHPAGHRGLPLGQHQQPPPVHGGRNGGGCGGAVVDGQPHTAIVPHPSTHTRRYVAGRDRSGRTRGATVRLRTVAGGRATAR